MRSRLLPDGAAPAGTSVHVEHHSNMWMDARRLSARQDYFQQVGRREPLDLWTAYPVLTAVLEHPDGVVLFDTGCSSRWRTTWHDSGIADVIDLEPVAVVEPLERQLGRVGCRPADVRAVVVSHLHMDHAGGLPLFDGTGVPIYVQEAERVHAQSIASVGGGAYIREEYEASDLNWVPVHGDLEILPGVKIVSLPGHSPGCQGLTVVRPDVPTVVFASDAIQVGDNVRDGRPVQSGGVYDSIAWRRTVQELLNLRRETDTLVVMGHEPRQLDELLDLR